MRCSTLLSVTVVVLLPAIGLAEPAAPATTPPVASEPATPGAATAPAAPAATTAEPAPAPMAETPSPAMSTAARAAVDQRIRTLRADLEITPAEAPLWDAFAQAMRENAARTDALFAQRARSVASMSAVENMRSYAQIARDYADSTERLANAFATLYGSLSEPQRQSADKLFREQATPPPPPRARKRR